MNKIVQVDHIVPLSKGGKDQYNNLQLLHTECHIKKKNRFDASALDDKISKTP